MSSTDADGIHPQYHKQSGYDGQYPPDWETRKDAVKRRDSYTCQDCGIEAGEGKMLDGHHIEHLSAGGSNRLSNLELLCIDCHNDRHDHDIREGRDGYEPEPGLWDRLRQVVYAVVGGLVLLPLHGAGIYALLTQAVSSPLWLAGSGYLLVLAVALFLRPRSIAALYTVAGATGVAIIDQGMITEIGGMSTSLLVFTAWIPALLAVAWWWIQRGVYR